MGQRLGKAAYVPEVKPFLNLPEKQIYLLWEAFNNIAAGFGLGPEEFTDICLAAELPNVLGLTENRVAAAAAAVFTVFDTDENDLVDALEFLAAFAMCSGMDFAKKIEFAFNCYDFDESGELSVDEMTLSFRSTLLGMAKLTAEEPPSEAKLEELANYAFQKADRNADNKISKQEFRDYCIFEPDVRSWLNFYHDPEDVAVDAEELDDDDLVLEGQFASSPRRGGGGAMKKKSHSRHPSLVAAAAAAAAVAEEATGREAAGAAGAARGVGGGGGGGGGAKPGEGSGAAASSGLAGGEWRERAAQVAWHPLPAIRPEAPGGQSLEWVHGYNSAVMRNNLRYTSLHHVVYPAAGVGVVLAKDPLSQRHYVEHTDDITALAVHIEKGRNIVATGQVGEVQPKVCLWDPDTMETLCTIDDFHEGAIVHIAFSPNGRSLVTVGQDAEHMVAVYELE